MAGLFQMPTPEAVRQNTRQGLFQRSAELARAPAGRGPVQAAAQAGGLFGESLGRAMGGVTPGEQEAMKFQEVQSLIQERYADKDLTDPMNQISMMGETAQLLGEAGFQAQAMQALDMANKIRSQIPGNKAPTTRKIRDGDEVITQEWNSAAGEWVEVARGTTQRTSGSEFERLVNKQQTIGLTPVEEKRLNVLAGTEMRRGEEERITQKKIDRAEGNIDDLRKEFRSGSEHMRNIVTSVDAAIAAMDSGQGELADRLLSQVMSQVQDTDVRAMQMYTEFDKPFGNLMERVSGQLSRFFRGTRTDEERATIRKTLEHFKNNYASRSLLSMRDMYRDTAKNQGLDPFRVVPPSSPEDIRDYPNIDKKEKLRLLRLYFPERFGKAE